MNCDDKQKAFNDAFSVIQTKLKNELDAIASDTEAKAKQISDDFEADHDLSEGVGASAGTAVGGLVGGPAGAVVGEAIGRTIGSLFTLEIGMRRETFSLDIPQTTMQTQDFSFDLPTVVMRDTDMSFDVPTMEMRTQEGPPIPETTIRMEQQCIDLGPFGRACTDVPVTVITWKKTYLDVPVTVMKRQNIVIGLPQVEMRRQEIKLDLPDIRMARTEFSADVPYVTLRFIKDAGKRTAALAAALAQSAQDAAVKKQIEYKQRLRSEIAPLALEMFGCFRKQIVESRDLIIDRFSGQIQALRNAVIAIAGKGVPDDNPELSGARAALDSVLKQQEDALKPLDDALAKLDASIQQAMAQFLGDGEPRSEAKGGLGNFTLSKDLNNTRQHSIPGLIGFTSKAPRKGLFLTLGLNRIDPAAYGTTGDLRACENDANDMAMLAGGLGFNGSTLLSAQATSSAVLASLNKAAAQLESGDIFLLTYSGHGGQVGDVFNEEEDGLNETWCLYDRQLIDDELYAMWSKFKPGVRIVVFSDSCHSGTVTRAAARNLYYEAAEAGFKSEFISKGYKALDMDLQLPNMPFGQVKALPFDVSWRNYLANRELYNSLQYVAGSSKDLKETIGATVILISGCQDNQLSLDGNSNGAFTEALKFTWANGTFNGNYKKFRDAIVARPMPPSQTPQYSVVGSLNLAFEAQKPFVI